MRLACKKDGEDKDNLICNVCKERQGSRIDEWEKELQNNTIWTGELKDDNNRIALISLKFDLSKWLNGDLMNTLLIRNRYFDQCKNTLEKINFNQHKNNLKKILNGVRNINNLESIRDFVKDYYDNIEQFLGLFDGAIKSLYNCKGKGIQKIDKIVTKSRKSGVVNYNSIKDQIESPKNEYIKDAIQEGITIDIVKKELVNLRTAKSNQAHSGKHSQNNNYDYFMNKLNYWDNRLNGQLEEFLKGIFAIGFLFIQINNLLMERSIGSQWEELIKRKLGGKVNFKQKHIDWQKLDDDDIEFLATMLLQFLLRKNPSPARLRRVWETTQSFFEDLERRILNVADMPERERYYWELDSNLNSNEVSKKDGEYEDGDVEFWKRGNKVYTISWIGNRKDDTKVFYPKYKNGNQSDKIDSLTLRVDDNNKSVRYKPYFTILEPTPVSWQFAIPARYVPALINNLEKEYLRNFGFVYGKLPLRVGVVIQHYKKPLYIGIKALRNLRMDGVKWDTLKRKIKVSDLISRSSLNFANCPQGNCDEYYSIYELESGKALYNFYVYSDNGGKAVLLSPLRDLNCKDTVYFYPNTFDFEFLDTNARRNDIYYDRRSAQRVSELKSNRPYDLYDFCYFEYFNLFFFGENNAESANKSSSQLQKIISLVYSKLEDWKGEDESLKEFLISAFVNVLGLNDEDRKNKFANLMGFDNFAQIEESKSSEFKKGLYMLIDAFEFWHTTLKK